MGGCPDDAIGGVVSQMARAHGRKPRRCWGNVEMVLADGFGWNRDAMDRASNVSAKLQLRCRLSSKEVMGRDERCVVERVLGKLSGWPAARSLYHIKSMPGRDSGRIE
jgi:hypothetical protein